jgi:hypothetical protein
LHQRKNSTVLAHHTKNSTCSCTSSHKNIQPNSGVQLKLKTKHRRRRTGDQQLPRRRRASSQELNKEEKGRQPEQQPLHQQSAAVNHTQDHTIQISTTG